MIPWPTVVKQVFLGDQPDIGIVREAFERDIETYLERGNAEEAALLRLELDGGPCPVCGKPFVKRSVRIRGLITIDLCYSPACRCFTKCPICERYLTWEVTMGLKTCRHCGYLTCPNKVTERVFLDETRKSSLKNKVCGGKIILKRDGYWVCSQCGAEYGYEQLRAMFLVNEAL